jgi:hypothetical protein
MAQNRVATSAVVTYDSAGIDAVTVAVADVKGDG